MTEQEYIAKKTALENRINSQTSGTATATAGTGLGLVIVGIVFFWLFLPIILIPIGLGMMGGGGYSSHATGQQKKQFQTELDNLNNNYYSQIDYKKTNNSKNDEINELEKKLKNLKNADKIKK